jgi:hypothetical protein
VQRGKREKGRGLERGAPFFPSLSSLPSFSLITLARSSRTPLADSRPSDWTDRENRRVRAKAVMARPRRLWEGRGRGPGLRRAHALPPSLAPPRPAPLCASVPTRHGLQAQPTHAPGDHHIHRAQDEEPAEEGGEHCRAANGRRWSAKSCCCCRDARRASLSRNPCTGGSAGVQGGTHTRACLTAGRAWCVCVWARPGRVEEK